MDMLWEECSSRWEAGVAKASLRFFTQPGMVGGVL